MPCCVRLWPGSVIPREAFHLTQSHNIQARTRTVPGVEYHLNFIYVHLFTVNCPFYFIKFQMVRNNGGYGTQSQADPQSLSLLATVSTELTYVHLRKITDAQVLRRTDTKHVEGI